MVCISLGLGLGNLAKNRTVWFPVWENVAQTEPNQTSPALVLALCVKFHIHRSKHEA